MSLFDRDDRALRRLGRLTRMADAFATSPKMPGNEKLDTNRKRLPTAAIRLVGEYLAQFNWPMPPQLTFRGIRTATRDEQTPIEEADAEILLSAHFMTASGVRSEFEIPVAVRQNQLLEPSVAIVNGSPRIIAQSLVDEVTKAGTFRQKIDPRGNIYGPPMDQLARDIYLETEDRLKERDRFSRGMYSVGQKTAQGNVMPGAVVAVHEGYSICQVAGGFVVVAPDGSMRPTRGAIEDPWESVEMARRYINSLLGGTAAKTAAQCEQCGGSGVCVCNALPITDPNRESCPKCGGTAQCPGCGGRGTNAPSMPPGYIGPGKVSKRAQGLSCQYCQQPIVGQPKKVRYQDSFVWADEECAQRAKSDPNYKPNVAEGLYGFGSRRTAYDKIQVEWNGQRGRYDLDPATKGTPNIREVLSDEEYATAPGPIKLTRVEGFVDDPYLDKPVTVNSLDEANQVLREMQKTVASKRAQAEPDVGGPTKVVDLGPPTRPIPSEELSQDPYAEFYWTCPCGERNNGVQEPACKSCGQQRTARRAQEDTCKCGHTMSSHSHGDCQAPGCSCGSPRLAQKYDPGARVNVGGEPCRVVEQIHEPSESGSFDGTYRVEYRDGRTEVVPESKLSYDKEQQTLRHKEAQATTCSCAQPNCSHGGSSSNRGQPCRNDAEGTRGLCYDCESFDYKRPPRQAQVSGSGMSDWDLVVGLSPMGPERERVDPNLKNAIDAIYPPDWRDLDDAAVAALAEKIRSILGTEKQASRKRAQGWEQGTWNPPIVDGQPLHEGTKVKGPRGQTGTVIGRSGTSQPRVTVAWDDGTTQQEQPANLKIAQLGEGEILRVVRESDVACNGCGGGKFTQSQQGLTCVSCGSPLAPIGQGVRAVQAQEYTTYQESTCSACGGQIPQGKFRSHDNKCERCWQATRPEWTRQPDETGQQGLPGIGQRDPTTEFDQGGGHRVCPKCNSLNVNTEWLAGEDGTPRDLALVCVDCGQVTKSAAMAGRGSKQAAHDEDGQPAEHNEERKDDDFTPGQRVKFDTSFRARTRGGPSYLIDKGTSAEVIRDVFEDGTRFEVQLEDGRDIVVPREILKGAGRLFERAAQTACGRCQGSGVCPWCKGKGTRPAGEQCGFCTGSGTCPACQGVQQQAQQPRPSPTVDQVLREVEGLKGQGYDDVDVLLAVHQKYPQLADAVMADARDKGMLDV